MDQVKFVEDSLSNMTQNHITSIFLVQTGKSLSQGSRFLLLQYLIKKCLFFQMTMNDML